MKNGNKNEQKGSKMFNSFVRKAHKYLNDSGMKKKKKKKRKNRLEDVNKLNDLTRT